MHSPSQSVITLNAKQREVLEWIKSGCPPEIYDGDNYAHRLSARALASRGLVTITGRGPAWSAVTTPRGEAWPTATAEDMAALESHQAAGTVKGLTPAEARQALVNELTRRRAVAEEDITLFEEQWDYDELKLMRLAAPRSPNRPHGKVLVISQTGYRSPGNYVLSFETYLRDLVEHTDVVVPERVSQYRSQVRDFMDDKDYQYVSKQHVPRAARIYQAIVLEGERRGLGAPTYDRGALTFHTEYGAYTFEIREQGSRSEGYMYEDDRQRLIRQGAPKWRFADHRKFTGNGKLQMRQGSPPSSYRPILFADRKIVRLESRLTEAFIRFEIWQLEEIEHERQRKLREEQEAREAERRKRALEAARVQAKIAYEADAKWKHFRKLTQSSEEAARQREFLDKMRESVGALSAEERDAALAYLQEMEATIDSTDPITAPGRVVPQIAEPSTSDLEPFMPKPEQSRRSLFGW